MTEDKTAHFIERWQPSGGAERANYQLFLAELCDVLDVSRPEPTVDDETLNEYVFEKNVVFDNGDGTTSTKRIDLYRRGKFVCETKQGTEQREKELVLSEQGQERQKKRKKGHGKRGTKGYDDTMVRARGQAEQYARHLPADEGRPPFLIVIDVGHTIELYAEFSQTGGVYTAFPDPQSHRIKLDELADPEIRERLHAVWTDPLALDPARRSAKVTREIAAKLAELAKSLEAAGHDPETVAHFLMRCLFTMFAEDIDLLPKDAFLELLRSIEDVEHFPPIMRQLWQTMNEGGFSTQLREKVLQFNGGLFAECEALPLTEDQLQLLVDAAAQQWKDVEPAIFGTLLERALDPVERHKLGAHYTPRAYVERLVVPTVVEPLRAEWDAARAAAITLATQGETNEAVEELHRFHDRLCEVKVLDPACGSGNFLYVVLEHLKRLEGELFDTFGQIAEVRQTMMEWEESTLGQSQTVDPHQLLGIEINPRAAAIAELVLWIGYLQWHFRTRGKVAPPEPVIKNFKNIDCRDAVLAYDGREEVLDDEGNPVTIWDGRTTKTHPVTGEEVPDDTARVPTYRYLNPRKAEWPSADFVVGNPPFVGNKRMRTVLGSGYVEAIREAWKEVGASTDYVMYWWHKAAVMTSKSILARFGFITTNSITQKLNRKIVDLACKDSLTILFAIPDHPWVDAASGADVRISMTVAANSGSEGTLLEILTEKLNSAGVAIIEFAFKSGVISPSLSVGIGASSFGRLNSNEGLAYRGVITGGKAFLVTQDELHSLSMSERARVFPFHSGRDLTKIPRRLQVIDLFPIEEETTVRSEFPSLYQRLSDGVRPHRLQQANEWRKVHWWLFSDPARKLRTSLDGLTRYVITPRTSEHRFFAFAQSNVRVESEVIAIASNDAFILGVCSARVHLVFATFIPGAMGVGNQDRYIHSERFPNFPFPNATDNQKQRIRELGEQLDAHRKRQQEKYEKLTMTGMYNVLEKLRSGEELTAKEKTIHEQGLVSVLKQIHDDLDAAVADAYGWPVDLSDEEILERLVALNHERAEEEKRGLIRWLRPEYQNPDGKTQQAMLPDAKEKKTKKSTKAKIKKQPWPKTLSDQAAAVQTALSAIATPADEADVAKRFTRANKARIAELLETLASLGRARQLEDGKFLAV